MDINDLKPFQAANLDRLRRHYEHLLNDRALMHHLSPQITDNYCRIMNRINLLTDPFLIRNIYPAGIRVLTKDEYID